MSDQKETFWDTENSETEMDCEDVDTDSSIEAHKLRLEKKKVKFQKDEINTIDPVKVDLPRKLKTIHKVDDELISTAPLTYSQNQVKRIKKAAFILISDSDVEGPPGPPNENPPKVRMVSPPAPPRWRYVWDPWAEVYVRHPVAPSEMFSNAPEAQRAVWIDLVQHWQPFCCTASV